MGAVRGRVSWSRAPRSWLNRGGLEGERGVMLPGWALPCRNSNQVRSGAEAEGQSA